MGKDEKLDEGLRCLKDGSIVEGLGTGGKVLIVRTEPEFARDILPYFSNTIMVLIALVMLNTTNKVYMPIFSILLVSPLQNYFGVGDNKNLSVKSQKLFEKDKRFDIPLQFFVIFETCTWIWALITMSDDFNPKGFWFSFQKPETNCDYFGFVVLISFLGAVNVVVGHELMHHREFHNKIFGTMPATKFMYSQLIDEHLKGHHKTVATMVDPATSRKNETLYAFCLRSMYGSLTNVWGYERDKITKRYGADASAFTFFFYNKMVWYQVLHASILYSIYFFLGWESLKFQFCYIFVGLYWVETVNYIEHYGIIRKKDKNGVDESIGKMHSWNQLSGAIIVRLQRHSDHHEHSFRPYQILRRMDDAPYFPFEYLHCYYLSLIPPVWFLVMNPRVEALDDIKNGRKNKKNSQWNNIMPATDDDVNRMRVGWACIAALQVLVGYLSFF